MMVSGMIQQPMEMMFIVLDKCCEKKMVDLRLDVGGRVPCKPLQSHDQ